MCFIFKVEINVRLVCPKMLKNIYSSLRKKINTFFKERSVAI